MTAESTGNKLHWVQELVVSWLVFYYRGGKFQTKFLQPGLRDLVAQRLIDELIDDRERWYWQKPNYYGDDWIRRFHELNGVIADQKVVERNRSRLLALTVNERFLHGQRKPQTISGWVWVLKHIHTSCEDEEVRLKLLFRVAARAYGAIDWHAVIMAREDGLAKEIGELVTVYDPRQIKDWHTFVGEMFYADGGSKENGIFFAKWADTKPIYERGFVECFERLARITPAAKLEDMARLRSQMIDCHIPVFDWDWVFAAALRYKNFDLASAIVERFLGADQVKAADLARVSTPA